jgi:transketolase
MATEFGPRRAITLQVDVGEAPPLSAAQAAPLERYDLIYRSLCAVLFNYVPLSGHPGGSVSSGRIVAGLLFGAMDYDPIDPDRPEADLISYAAGHKALGLYAMWALRNEVLRLGAPELLPEDLRLQLRLEDLLGFRRNPITSTPFFKQFGSKALDGHPTPVTPFLKLSTGASGIGMSASLGLAYGARDFYGGDAPRVHIIEGEGGLTPGRIAEGLASAGSSGLSNAIVHLDWNQASIDSNKVCREGDVPGDYVQWTPAELFLLHDWNVISVADGFDLQQVHAAQRKALAIDNGQPTAIVYRTVKGWRYGIEGKGSHGAGHKFCSSEYHESLRPLRDETDFSLPEFQPDDPEFIGEDAEAGREKRYWETLQAFRALIEGETEMVAELAGRLRDARKRLDGRGRAPRAQAPDVDKIYAAALDSRETPAELRTEPGSSSTLRGELGKALGYFNKLSGGAILAGAADLLGSTNVNGAGKGFPDGFYHASDNSGSRILSVGGICEDALAGVISGVSSYGRHIGAGSSYAAFIAPLGHINARLHAIGQQMRREIVPTDQNRALILICAHAGLKTGEDGPTHADPQSLQLLQENFAPGMAVTLTPWDPSEVWPLFAASLAARPAVIAPFVTRPAEKILDRAALGLAPAEAARKGLYLLRAANGEGDGSVVLQGSGVTYAFIEDTLPLLSEAGIDLNVYYVASAELFDALPREEREEIFPEARAQRAMGISGFTLPTLYRWIMSQAGRDASLYPFMHGEYLGSGPGHKVLAQAGLSGRAQFEAISSFVRGKVRS